MLERAEELGVLDVAIAATRSAGGRLLVIEGPTGIGKTSLSEGTRGPALPGPRYVGIAVTTLYAATQPWPAVVLAWATVGGQAATLLIGALAELYPVFRAIVSSSGQHAQYDPGLPLRRDRWGSSYVSDSPSGLTQQRPARNPDAR